MRMIPDMDDDEKGKLFVGGLSWETTQENLQRYFQRYGEVIDCVVMKNNESGRSRGFGFVTYADFLNVNIVLQNGPHNLDGRTIDPKPCNPRTLTKPKKGGGYPKVFLGGLPSNVTETDLRVYFGRYGTVMEVVIMYDQEKKKSRGFGFLSFQDDASVDRVTGEHYINLNGKQVEIKKAEPRDGSGGGGGGGGGGGMGIGGGGGGGGGKMNSDNNSQWGPPQGAPMGMMQGPNGQIGGPPMNMPMGAPNMMGGYQGGWGTSPQQQSYGYGTPSAPSSYPGGWGAPPGPQGPPPHQWSNYATPQQSQGYGSYDMYNSTTGPSGASSGGNWNSWNNMIQNSAGTGTSDTNRILKRKLPYTDEHNSPQRTLKLLKTSEIYSRGGQSGGGGPPTGAGQTGGGGGGGMPPTGPTNSSSKTGSDYSYGAGYGNYSNDQQSSFGPRSYGNDNAAQQQPPYAAPQTQEEFLKNY